MYDNSNKETSYEEKDPDNMNLQDTEGTKVNLSWALVHDNLNKETQLEIQ